MPRFLPTAVLVISACVLAGTSGARDLSIILGGNDYEGDEAAKNNLPDRMSCVAYWIVVRTGDVANGGTDGSVSITINGDSGSTGEVPLGGSGTGWIQPRGAKQELECEGFVKVYADDANAVDNFEAGSVENYTILAPRIGNVRDITVRMDAAGTAGSGWFLQSVDIERGEPIGDMWRRTGDVYRGIHNNWLESGVPQTVSNNRAARTTYEITFQTGTDTGAGTDSDITVRLEGMNGFGKQISFEQVVNPFISGNAFENGARDTAVLPEMPEIRRLKSITVTTADNYAGSAWQLSSVEVASPSLCGGSPGVACKFASPEIVSFGNVWLDGSRRSATVAAGSGAPAKEAVNDIPDLSPPERCAQLLRATNVDRRAAAKMCPRSTDGYRDAACLLVASVRALPLDEWADKCIDDPEGASAELKRIADGGRQEPPPPPPEANPGPTEAEPPSQPDELPPSDRGMSEEARCMGMVDGRVAWNRNGDRQWEQGNIAALCAGATDADARIACFEDRIAAGEGWDTAIPACAGDDTAPSGAMPNPGSNPGSSAEAQRCKALLQDQVPWQIDPPERHWAQEDLDALCDGSTNAAATVRCFQQQLWNNGNGNDLYTAIDACREN